MPGRHTTLMKERDADRHCLYTRSTALSRKKPPSIFHQLIDDNSSLSLDSSVFFFLEEITVSFSLSLGGSKSYLALEHCGTEKERRENFFTYMISHYR